MIDLIRLIGIYFRSNHERLLDELSRAITIIAHGLEQIVRDKDVMVYDNKLNDQFTSTQAEKRAKKAANDLSYNQEKNLQIDSTKQSPLSTDKRPSSGYIDDDKSANYQHVISTNQTKQNEQHDPVVNRSILEDFQISLGAHSKCYGSPDNLSKKRGDYLYE